MDKQGLTGRKSEYLSLPYKSISRFSIETAGTFDLDAELKIWISSDPQPTVSKKFNKSVDVYEVQKLLAGFVLGVIASPFTPCLLFTASWLSLLTWQTDITKDGVNLFCITIIFSN